MERGVSTPRAEGRSDAKSYRACQSLPATGIVMRTLVILPTYNERDNLANLIPEILRQPGQIEVLVVDDNSPDGTGQIADAIAREEHRLHVLHRERKEGLGRAYV